MVKIRLLETFAETLAEKIAERVKVSDITIAQTIEHTPALCPVCSGSGQVKFGFYPAERFLSTSAFQLSPTCKACSGRGVV